MEGEFCLIYNKHRAHRCRKLYCNVSQKNTASRVSALDSGLILYTHKSHSPLAVKFDEPAYSKQLLHTVFDSYWVSLKTNS